MACRHRASGRDRRRPPPATAPLRRGGDHGARAGRSRAAARGWSPCRSGSVSSSGAMTAVRHEHDAQHRRPAAPASMTSAAPAVEQAATRRCSPGCPGCRRTPRCRARVTAAGHARSRSARRRYSRSTRNTAAQAKREERAGDRRAQAGQRRSPPTASQSRRSRSADDRDDADRAAEGERDAPAPDVAAGGEASRPRSPACGCAVPATARRASGVIAIVASTPTSVAPNRDDRYGRDHRVVARRRAAAEPLEPADEPDAVRGRRLPGQRRLQVADVRAAPRRRRRRWRRRPRRPDAPSCGAARTGASRVRGAPARCARAAAGPADAVAALITGDGLTDERAATGSLRGRAQPRRGTARRAAGGGVPVGARCGRRRRARSAAQDAGAGQVGDDADDRGRASSAGRRPGAGSRSPPAAPAPPRGAARRASRESRAASCGSSAEATRSSGPVSVRRRGLDPGDGAVEARRRSG